jgi:hypothetical protein
MPVPLQLYISNPKRTGREQEKVFATEATEINEHNRHDFFLFDHTIILFRDGYAAQRNFISCSTLVLDIDNKGVDEPQQWTTVNSTSERLTEMGITHTIVTSRNHETKKGTESSRPRFHVYLPLAVPCNLMGYRAMCEWLIAHFHSDPAVKSPAQFIYGNAGNPNKNVLQIEGTHCFDQFFQTQQFHAETNKRNSTLPSTPLTGVHPADGLNEKGRDFIKQFLQKKGWKYLRQDSVNEFWQRPGKDRSKNHSATIKLDAPLLHVFSSNCLPLKEWKAYNFFQLYALLEHVGNESAAAKDLAGQGYGDALTTQPVELPEFIVTPPHNTESDDEELDDEIDDNDCPENFPEHLFKIPGFVSELAQYINSVAHNDQPIYSLAAALAFQALLCAQNVKDPTGIRTNPYIIVAGRSASGKDKGREIIKKIFTQLVNTPKYKTERHYKPLHYFIESVASYQALIKRLKRNDGVLLWLWDELGKELASWTRDRSANLSGIKTELMRLYSSADSIYVPHAKASTELKEEEADALQQPNLVLYGTAEKETLYNAFSVDMLTDGLIGRLMIFEGNDYADRIQQTEQRPLPESILETADWWLERRFQNINQAIPQPDIVPVTPEAENILQRFQNIQKQIQYKNDRIKDALWGRAQQQARQFALIYACSVSKENPVIDEDAAQWAYELVSYLIKRKIYIADRHVADSEFDRQQKEILRYIESCKGKCTMSMICRAFRKLKKRERDEIFENLEQTSAIRKETRKDSRKTTINYVINKKKEND